MKRIFMISLVLAGALAAGGCVVSGSVGARAHVRAPSLVYVAPGVQVVEDYHEPVFFSDGYYWRYYGGVWYRSHVHYGSWTRVRVVPVGVRRIDRPNVYVHYRANGRARGHVRNDRPVVRDNRSRGHVRSAPPRSAPARAKVRDNRNQAPPPPARGKAKKEKKKEQPKVRVRDHR